MELYYTEVHIKEIPTVLGCIEISFCYPHVITCTHLCVDYQRATHMHILSAVCVSCSPVPG